MFNQKDKTSFSKTEFLNLNPPWSLVKSCSIIPMFARFRIKNESFQIRKLPRKAASGSNDVHFLKHLSCWGGPGDQKVVPPQFKVGLCWFIHVIHLTHIHPYWVHVVSCLVSPEVVSGRCAVGKCVWKINSIWHDYSIGSLLIVRPQNA